MQQTVFVASVYLIPVLIVEHRCNVLQGFWRGAADRGPLIATISARGNADGRVVGSFAMHLPVIMSLMLMDPIGVTADDTCQEIIRQ